MGDNIYLGDRNGVRTPMQWNSDRNAGFSRCDPARLYFPVVMDPIYGYQVVNVEAQLSDQSSLLHWTRNMIALRKLFQVFGRGTLKFLNPSNRKILAYLRDLDRGDGSHETVLCVANLSRFAQPASLDLASYAGSEPVEMLGYVPFPTITAEPYAITLAPYSFLWLELQPASVEPAAEAAPEAVEEVLTGGGVILDLLERGWAGLAGGDGHALLGPALLSWLPRQRWFGAKARRMVSARTVDWVEIPLVEGRANAGEAPAHALLFVEIEYASGPPDTYQLPLGIATGVAAEAVTVEFPASVLASFASSAGTVAVYDATVEEGFRQGLLKLIERNASLPLGVGQAGGNESASAAPAAADLQATIDGDALSEPARGLATPVAPVPITAQPGEAAAPPRDEVSAAPGASTQQHAPRESPAAGEPAGGSLRARASTVFARVRGKEELRSRVGSAEQSNTSILFGRELILKIFRRIQPGENPDVEIGRYLTEGANFDRIPPFLGEIAMVPAAGEKTTLGMLQGLVANEGDGWQWFLEQLAGFFTAVAALPAPPQGPAASFLNEADPVEAQSYAGASLDAAALLGVRTAEMHLALAAPTGDAAFAPEACTAADFERDARRIAAQITSTLEVMRVKLSTLKDVTADHAALLLSRRIDLFSRANAITSLRAAGQRIRIHGDYHLGQTLRTDNAKGGDFVLLDFEGEPSKPLAERRQKQSPLRDVAGMLRSLSYAAYTALDQFSTDRTEEAGETGTENLTRWAVFWQNAASQRFLNAYRETIAANPELLPAKEQAQPLLDAYVLEKALYELLYELNNRPTWLRIPLSGILVL
jgi:maltose alpha-D-glucosyltransferase / alpha-amylase